MTPERISIDSFFLFETTEKRRESSYFMPHIFRGALVKRHEFFLFSHQLLAMPRRSGRKNSIMFQSKLTVSIGKFSLRYIDKPGASPRHFRGLYRMLFQCPRHGEPL